MVLISAVTALDVLKYAGYIGIAILGLMFMIVVHELGHFVAGRIFKFKINEFSVGFGPAIFKRKSKKTDITYALRWIPMGGYCAFEGEDEESDNPDAFNRQKPWKRIIVLAMGAIFNFIAALLLITIFFSAFGNFFPKITNLHQFTDDAIVQCFEEGDIILEVNGQKLWCLANASDLNEKLATDGEKEVKIIRNGETMVITPVRGNYVYQSDGEQKEGNGYGISYTLTPVKQNFFVALGDSFVFIFKMVGSLFKTLGALFTGALGLKGTIGGPITTIASMVKLTQAGFFYIMYGVCLLSANLAVFNLLPLPGLDGSKIVFTTIEWIRGKPINKKFESWFHVIGIFALLALTIIFDIINWI